MLISCPECETDYRVPASAIPPGGREVRCSACEATWFERGEMAQVVAAAASGADVTPPRRPGGGGTSQRARRAPEALPAKRSSTRSVAPGEILPPALSPARVQQQALVTVFTEEARFTEEAGRAVAEAVPSRMPAPSRIGSAAARLRDGLMAALGTWRAEEAPASPGDAAARDTRRRLQVHAANRMTPLRLLGWTAWIASLAGLVFLLVARQDLVRSVFPPAASIYERIAPSAPPPGLRVEARLERFGLSSEGPVAELRGLVRNAGASAAVPSLALAVTTAEGEEVQTLPLPRVSLPPAGERPFTVRALVPEGAQGLRLQVSPAQGGVERMPVPVAATPAGHAGPPRLDMR
ncbi:zinc-ribbon domain-containing protein [Parvularcula oceani]|uniref:zinc-ribbon domain-containing protein n=1 Tax=Parvularcula oceani TaxID=1247963 RepID=UPI0004E116D0|nr:zinc-ribbon domain-containing protein [Parvularcula oceani]